MTLHSKENLRENLKDKNFRDSFVIARVDGKLAFQIRYLRENEGWTQAELARRLGSSQNAVWRLENPRYGKASVSTLKKLASIFDVALDVRFLRFSELLDQVLNQSTDSITVDSFDKDYRFHEIEIPVIKTKLNAMREKGDLAKEEAGRTQEDILKSQRGSSGFKEPRPELIKRGGIYEALGGRPS